MSYKFSPLYPYLPEDIDFCFHLTRFFNYCQVKPVTHCKNGFGQFRSSSDKGRESLCEIQQYVV